MSESRSGPVSRGEEGVLVRVHTNDSDNHPPLVPFSRVPAVGEYLDDDSISGGTAWLRVDRVRHFPRGVCDDRADAEVWVSEE
jgi:hypothetical protein